MNSPLSTFIFLFLLSAPYISADTPKIRTLCSSLNQKSVAQQLAFYELYPETDEGKKALKRSWELLWGSSLSNENFQFFLGSPSLETTIVSLINKMPNQETPNLNDSHLIAIDKLANRLGNRQIKGFRARSENEVLSLSAKEIEITRAVFLTQISDPSEREQKIRSYEAAIDLMALQITAKLEQNPTPEQTIRAINQFIFQEMGFRFPPHSEHLKDIDLYTFLPSVIDSRHGVCLGVSILYLGLADRLNLPLEIITPPGHIYLRYREGDILVNIETTARGIHIDSEEYLGVDTRALQIRSRNEVPGFAKVNEASVHFKKANFAKALKTYQAALPYLPNDPVIKELMGFCHLSIGNIEEGTILLKEIADYCPPHAINRSTIACDYLSGNVDIEGIQAIFQEVDETRASLLKKKDVLERTMKKHPHFREGWLYLGVTWLQLHRAKEGIVALETYHSLEPGDPKAEYYLASLYADRLHYQKAWEHLRNAERIVHAKNHYPKALKNLRRQLSMLTPE